MKTREELSQGQLELQTANPRTGGVSRLKEIEIVVVFTKLRSIWNAVRFARRMAKGLGARIRLLVPHVVPYPLPLDEPAVPTQFLERSFRSMVDGIDVEVLVDIRICRDPWQAIKRQLRPGSIVVVGGRIAWWPSEETRLVRKLQAAGHHLFLV